MNTGRGSVWIQRKLCKWNTQARVRCVGQVRLDIIAFDSVILSPVANWESFLDNANKSKFILKNDSIYINQVYQNEHFITLVGH